MGSSKLKYVFLECIKQFRRFMMIRPQPEFEFMLAAKERMKN